MVSNVKAGSKDDSPKSVVTRVSRECSSKGIFVGSVGSVSVKEGDHIFVGPSPSLIRPSELGEEHIFQVSAEDGSVIAEPATALQLKIHEMTPLHLEIYKANPSIGCVLECRSTSSIVASLMIKGKRLTIRDPEIVLGPSENKTSVFIPVIDACSELPALAEKIASELKSQAAATAAAAAAASVTSATPAKTTTETEVKTEEPVKETPAAIEGDSAMDDPELLEIKPTEDDLIDKDEEMNEDESAEIQANVDLDQIRCSAVIVRNKGFFVWAKTWTECLNRAEQINQMLEICNQMKLMGFNVYAHLMADPNPHQTLNQRKNSYKKQEKNGEKNSTTSPQKSAAQNEATGGTAPKRPRIEPPAQTSTVDPKEAASGTEAGGEVANKKRKWVNKKRGGRQQQDQPAAQQPQQQAQKQTLNTKKEPIKTPLQRPAPGRYPSQERGNQNSTRGRRGGQTRGSGPRGGGMHGRMGQVPSPWAQPQMQQNPWYGY